MFDEKEPGKPQNWGWTIGIIMVVSQLMPNLTHHVSDMHFKSRHICGNSSNIGLRK
jgi:hypothetical protein